MSDDDADEEPVVELGPGASVDGAPLGRVASRLSWPRSKSDVIAQEGTTELRTADGPQALEDVLTAVETPYFATRREFVEDVRGVIGYGPVETTPPAPDGDTADGG